MFKQYFSWRNITIFGDVIVIWTIIVGLVNAPWPGEAAFVALVCIVLVYHWYQAGGFQWIRKKMRFNTSNRGAICAMVFVLT